MFLCKMLAIEADMRYDMNVRKSAFICIMEVGYNETSNSEKRTDGNLRSPFGK